MSNEKIDIVVSWLDDTDKIWQRDFENHAFWHLKKGCLILLTIPRDLEIMIRLNIGLEELKPMHLG